MAYTSADLLAEFSAADQATLSPLMSAIWSLYADKAPISPRLQYLYSLRQCYDVLLKACYTSVGNQNDDVRSDDSDVAAHLRSMWMQADAAVKEEETLSPGIRVPAVGTLCKQAPIHERVWPFGANPNSRRFRGDPVMGTIDPEDVGT